MREVCCIEKKDELDLARNRSDPVLKVPRGIQERSRNPSEPIGLRIGSRNMQTVMKTFAQSWEVSRFRSCIMQKWRND